LRLPRGANALARKLIDDDKKNDETKNIKKKKKKNFVNSGRIQSKNNRSGI